MALTTYAELKTAIGDWLNRSDLTSTIPDFVTLAEAELKKDVRVRRLENNTAFSVDAATESLPSDFVSLESIYHNGGTYYGPLSVVTPEQLAVQVDVAGSSGVPRFAAVVEDQILFAPAPDGTYSLRLVYWQGIAALSDANTSNWLLASHPDVYLYASLVQSAPYLKDDARVMVWEQRLEKSLEALRLYTWHQRFGGNVRRSIKTIGG